MMGLQQHFQPFCPLERMRLQFSQLLLPGLTRDDRQFVNRSPHDLNKQQHQRRSNDRVGPGGGLASRP